MKTRFLSFVLQNTHLDEFIDIHSRGSIVRHLNVRDVKEIPVPLPEIEEQEVIADYLEKQDEYITILQNRIESGIDLLQEKRQALITAAVTGQIDVTDWEPPEDDEPAPEPEAEPPKAVEP